MIHMTYLHLSMIRVPTGLTVIPFHFYC